MFFRHTLPPPRRSTHRFVFDFLLATVHSSARFRFIFRCCPPDISPATYGDHDELFELPVPNREADCLFSAYGHGLRRTMLSSRPLRMGFPALPSATAELVVLHFIAQHDP